MNKTSSLIEFIQEFSTEEACVNFLTDNIWSNHSYCPKCGAVGKMYEIRDRLGRYSCPFCKNQFSIKAGTIFDNSKIPLTKWFLAIYMLSCHSKGISSVQLAKDIKVTQKTAWFMNHRIRRAMESGSFIIDSTVEVDETYIGGKEGNKHKNKKGLTEKTAVIGIVERKTKKAIAFPVESASTKTVENKIVPKIKTGTNVLTDESKIYSDLDLYFNHFHVNHSRGQYAIGNINTNTVEGFFSHVKRTVIGTYHYISKKHMAAYMTGCAFRYANKSSIEEKLTTLLSNSRGKKITYKELVA